MWIACLYYLLEKKFLSYLHLPSFHLEQERYRLQQAIESWGIWNSIRAMYFDTTSSNTGRNTSTCVFVEQNLEKVLLSLACRHHLMEYGSVFEVSIGATSSLEVPLFICFKEYWTFINTNQYETGISTDAVAEIIKDIKDDTIEFTKKYLEQSHSQLRCDYREFVERVTIFLETASVRGEIYVNCSRTPWPLDVEIYFYSLKIWMFRSQFKLTSKKQKGWTYIYIFIAHVYEDVNFCTQGFKWSTGYYNLLLMKPLIK